MYFLLTIGSVLMSTPQSYLDKLEAEYKQLHTLIVQNKATAENISISKAIEYELARNHFKYFCKLIMPAQDFKWAWFHLYLMERINDLFLDQPKYYRKLIRMGDQHGKTTIAIVLAIPYALGRFPNARIISLSYGGDRASSTMRDIIKLIINPIYTKIFPHIKLADESMLFERRAQKNIQKLTSEVITNVGTATDHKQGKIISTGLEGSILGEPADYIFCDDLFKGIAEANSAKIRELKWGLLSGSVFSRQQSNSRMVLTGTWWHKEDCIGKIQSTYIDNQDNLPEGARKWELIEFNTIKDGRDYPYDKRKIGEYLWPEQRMAPYLDQQITNPILWQIKHQNIPSDADGILFKPTSFRYYDILPFNPQESRLVISIDTNYKDKQTSDKAGITIWAFYHKNAYLLEYFWQSFNLKDLLLFAKNLIRKYTNYHAFLVEDHSQGTPFKDMASDYGIYKVELFQTGSKSKWERAQIVLPIFDAGQVYLPSAKINNSINLLVNQYCNFTGEKGGKDDLVDSGVQAIMHYEYLLKDMPGALPITIARTQMLRDHHTIKRNLLHRPRL